MSLVLGNEIIQTWPGKDRKGVPMELENIAIVSVKVDPEPRILCKEVPIF